MCRHHIPEFNIAQELIQKEEWANLEQYLKDVRILLCDAEAHKNIHKLIKNRKIDKSKIDQILKDMRRSCWRNRVEFGLIK